MVRAEREDRPRKWRFEADNEVNTSAAYWKGTHLHRLGRRHALRAQRGHGQAALERAVRLELRLARVLVRHPDARLRPRLHRQHGRHDVRLRGEERQAALGAAARHATSTAPRRSTGARCSWAPTTASSTRSTRQPATRAGRSTPGGAVHAAPTVMDGLVYYAVCSTCGSAAQRAVARGPRRDVAVRARDGKRVWRFPAASTPTRWWRTSERVYITGRSHQYAFAPKGSEAAARKLGPTAAASLERAARKARIRSVTCAAPRAASGSPST